ncbi:MAG TPA: S53 family peptidase [Segeticoccus sp.]|uniref:S53 family peptidase n=1 Tax=Segeticoccus sp. TaxID=2706531 RepID=UPI002D7EDEB1|nr:S53 family peptidase [Segeticoccus sp.]HET8600457.1 S53 family peptidase [Segeticoccus sp.]
MSPRRLAITAVTAATLIATPAMAGAAFGAGQADRGRAALPNSAPTWAVDHRAGSGEPVVTSSASAGARMNLTLHVAMRHQGLAERWIASGKVVSPAQYRRTFAPTEGQVRRAAAWARTHGLGVSGTNRDAGSVYVTGTVRQVDAAFHAGIANATVHGRRGLVATRVPTVESASGVTGVAGLNTLAMARTHDVVNPLTTRSTLQVPQQDVQQARAHATAPVGDGSTSCATFWGQHLYPSVKKYTRESNYLCGYTPQQLGQMYAAGTAAVEAPRIAVVLWGDDSNLLKLTNEYMSNVGYPALPSMRYHRYVTTANSNMKQCDAPGTKVEQALDVQAAHAIAPNATIDYYGAASCGFVDLAKKVQQAVSAHTANVISMSWGSTTDAGATFADFASFDRAFKQAALTGISVFASTGDWGNNSSVNPDGRRGVGYPASSAYVTAVGGTAVGLAQNGTRAMTTGWEDRFYAQQARGTASWREFWPYAETTGAGGGVSTLYKRPTWQNGRVDGTSAYRMLPDVSALADPFTPYRIHYTTRSNTTKYTGAGGTSLAAPVVASLVAVSKARTGRQVGLAAPSLYRLMGSSAIRDVQHQSAGVYIKGGPTGLAVVGFDTKPENLQSNAAWDNVTGVGEPNGLAFLTTFGK